MGWILFYLPPRHSQLLYCTNCTCTYDLHIVLRYAVKCKVYIVHLVPLVLKYDVQYTLYFTRMTYPSFLYCTRLSLQYTVQCTVYTLYHPCCIVKAGAHGSVNYRSSQERKMKLQSSNLSDKIRHQRKLEGRRKQLFYQLNTEIGRKNEMDYNFCSYLISYLAHPKPLFFTVYASCLQF